MSRTRARGRSASAARWTSGIGGADSQPAELLALFGAQGEHAHLGPSGQ
ncbi:hypothetical protein ACFVXC_21855 [Streptomyces sp. NPDC058257]